MKIRYFIIIASFLTFFTSDADVHFVMEDEEKIELIQADTSEYVGANIMLSGHVSIKYGEKTIKCDTLTLDTEQKNIIANGNIVIDDEFGNSVTADSVHIKNGFKDGLLKKIKITLVDRSYLQAEDASFVGKDYFEMLDAEYSPCYECVKGDRLMWRIRAKHVEKNNDVVEYKDAFFDILNVPVMYLPYISIPSPTLKRRTGFLYPLFTYAKSNGCVVAPRFLWSISNSQEAILKPIFTTKSGTVFWGSYSYRFYSGVFDLDCSIAGTKSAHTVNKNDVSTPDNNELKKIDSNNYRGHLFSSIMYDVDKRNRLSAQLNLVSDKYYLRKIPFLCDDEKRLLESNICAENFYKDNYTSAKVLYFQTLRADERNSDVPVAAPVISHSSVFDVFNGQLSCDALFMHLNFSRKYETNKLFANMSWKRDFILDYGHVVTLEGVLSSSYNSISYIRNMENNSSLTDLSPMLGVKWQWPLHITYNDSVFYAILKPVVGFVYSPVRKLNSIYNDAYTSMYFFALNDANLLDVIRSPFSNQINDGTRIPYGVFFDLYKNTMRVADLFLGRSFNVSDVKNNISDMKHKHSNVISSFNLYPVENVTLFMNGSYSTHDDTFTRIEVGAKYDNNKIKCSARVFRYNLQNYYNRYNTYKGIHMNVEANVTRTVSVNGSIITGGSNCRLLKKCVGLKYKNECLTASVLFAQHEFKSGDIRPDRSVTLLFIFKNLGKAGFKI